MKRLVCILLATTLILIGCGSKDKVKYDPYGKGQKVKKSTKTVVENRQKGFDVQFTKEFGVRYIMITMNGVSGVKAIFDTGCSSMSISEMEILSLIKGGTIDQTDVGQSSVTIADGSERTLPSVRMNVSITDTKGQSHNATVEASVESNLLADVLIGNDIISQMGTVITIDDNRGIIHFE